MNDNNCVLGLPKSKDDPRINGGSGIYHTGDTVYLNCTSGKSFPAAKLQWFINNEMVSWFLSFFFFFNANSWRRFRIKTVVPRTMVILV